MYDVPLFKWEFAVIDIDLDSLLKMLSDWPPVDVCNQSESLDSLSVWLASNNTYNFWHFALWIHQQFMAGDEEEIKERKKSHT